jgi:hypothetical protein
VKIHSGVHDAQDNTKGMYKIQSVHSSPQDTRKEEKLAKDGVEAEEGHI